MQPNKLLIIDENDSTKLYLQRTLREAGFETLHPQSGMTALEAIQQLRPDLVILAYEMIDETGLAVVRAIRADSELYRLPVIMIGTAFNPAEAISVLENGADEYLVRSIKPMELGARVRAVLRRCYPQAYPTVVPMGIADFERHDVGHVAVFNETSLMSELRASLILVGIVAVGAGVIAVLLFWLFF